MTIKNELKKFTKSESGAITVDWVVLTAAIIGIAFMVIALVISGVNSTTNFIEDELVNASNIDNSTLIK